MAKEITYRRSFHSDRDFRGMLHSFDFDQALIGKKRIPGRIIEDGLEAPRNSLDTPIVAFDMRRKSEARYSDIPFGFELTRSLTSKRTEEIEVKSLKIPETPRELEQRRRRTPSVVARLMGLDAMPEEIAGSAKKIAADKHRLICPSRRQQLSQDGRMLPKPDELSAAEPLREIPIQGYYGDCDDERPPCEVLSFREHPQEKQLQEFKKNFAARHALHSRKHQPEDMNTNLVNKQGQKQAKHASCEKFVRSAAPEKLNEAKDFLDALEFLQSNKDFFMKVLHDPNPLFTRNIRHFCPPSKHGKPVSHLKANKTTKHSLESGNEGLHSYYSRAEFNEPRYHGLNQLEQGQRLQKAKILSDWRSPQKSRFQPNEEMPMRNLRHARQISLLGDNIGNGCINDQIPTRIVILKPSTGKHPNAKSATLSSSSPHANVNFKVQREEGKERSKAILQDAKERMKYSNQDLKRESGIGRNQVKDGPKDPREIAREIVKQVKDDVNRKLSKEVSRKGDALNTRTKSIGRRLSPQRLVLSSTDIGGMSDGEGSCTPSRRCSRNQGKSHSSLPNSPRCDKSCELSFRNNEDMRTVLHKFNSVKVNLTEDNPKSINLLRRKEASDESRQTSTRLRVATQSPRNLNKGSMDSALHSHALSATCPNLTLDSSRGDGLFACRKPGYQEKSSNFTDSDSKSSSPRVLSRSRSVPNPPIAANVHNFIADQKNGVFQERVNTAAKHKLADGPLLKGKISCLKDSFSLAKKKTNRKMSTLPEETPCADSLVSADATETTTPRHAFSAQRHCRDTESSTWTSLTAPESWSMLETNCNLSEQYSQIDCMLTPSEDFLAQAELAGRSVTGRGIGNNLISASLPEWASAADAVDSASETSLEKSEQPSPVSVLETPFQEESVSPVDFQEYGPNFDSLNELQLKLCLLHLDGAKSEYRSRFFGVQETASFEPLISHNRCGFPPYDNRCGFPPCDKRTWLANDGPCKPSECFSTHDIPCFNGRQVDLTYIRDVLVFSGFTRDDAILVKSFSLDHGLDPSIFSKLEQHYRKSNSLGFQSFGGKGKKNLPNALGRRLLFDVIDEIMLTKLGMPADHHPWVRADKPSIHFMRTGRKLIETIWAEVNLYFSLDHESQDDTLEDLAAKALSEGGSWLIPQSDVERVGFALEQGIFNTLVEEAALELLSL